ncbi:MAG TPA: diacylglycerol kinase family protein [Gaiellaceae bacterium]
MAGFLIVNPRSGDGEPSTDELVACAEGRGIACRVLERGDDSTVVASEADADVLGIAGGDGSLAQVAAVARHRGLPFVCIPFGTRNHFARDLGLDRADPLAGLAAFDRTEAVERRIDLGEVNGRVFLNNVSLGLYAGLVGRREHHRHRGEALAGLRALGLLVGERHRLVSRVDGETVRSRILLIANGHYDLTLFTLGERASLTSGALHLYAADGWLPHSWLERVAPAFEVVLAAPAVDAAIDGEPMRLELPLRFSSLPAALRVLVPSGSRAAGEGEIKTDP